MGQAKLRRLKEEQDRLAGKPLTRRGAAPRPDKLTCNNCQTDFTEFTMLDTRGMPGLDMACAGICPKCGHTTWGMSDPVWGMLYAETLAREAGISIKQLKFGEQALKSGG